MICDIFFCIYGVDSLSPSPSISSCQWGLQGVCTGTLLRHDLWVFPFFSSSSKAWVPTRLTPLSPSSAVSFQVLSSPPNVALDLSGGNTFSSVLGSTPIIFHGYFAHRLPSIPSPVRNTLKSRGNSDVNLDSTSTTTSIKPFTTSHHQHSYRPSKTESRKT